MTLNSREIRELIHNAHKIMQLNRCPTCNATGYVNYNDNGEDVKAGLTQDEERSNNPCEDCDEVGYKDIFIYHEE